MSEKITDISRKLLAKLPQYKKVRDFIEGADAIKAHDIALLGEPGKAYLPRISRDQEASEYAAYCDNALFENIVGQTLIGYSGLVFMQDPAYDLGPAEIFEDDADLQGTPLTEFLEETFEEIMIAARYGWLVERPPALPGASKLDEELAGMRPYLVPYKSENIIAWKMIRKSTRIVLGRVVLQELAGDNDTIAADQWRELMLDEDGFYFVRVWTRGEQGDAIPGEQVYPTMGGNRMREIPFYFFDPRGGRPEPGKSPLADITEINRSHYKSSADLEHGRMTSSLPTTYLLGFTKEEAEDVTLGGLNAIHSTNPEASVGMLEFTGQGLGSLEKALDQKTAMAAKMGSRMFSEDKKAAEAADTLRIRNSGESATLADIAKAISRIASQALSFAAKWMGQEYDCTVKLNTEYSAIAANPQEVTALLAAVQAGDLRVVDFIARLRKVGLVSSDATDEEIVDELASVKAEKANTLLAGVAAMKAAAVPPVAPVAPAAKGAA